MNDGHHYGKVPAISVFTNLDIPKRHEKLILWRKYYDYYNEDGTLKEGKEDMYPRYDNYPDFINVDKVTEIPADWKGICGVPLTFIDSFSSEQFEILGYSEAGNEFCKKFYENMHLCQPTNGGDKANSKSARYSPMVPFQPKNKENYYTASNSKHKMKKVYHRIFIKLRENV